MDKMTKSQKLKCLFGHHEFFEKGMMRQCIHCKLFQHMDLMTGTISNPKWIDHVDSFTIDFDLKEMDKTQKQLDEVNELLDGLAASITPVEYTQQIIISSSANSKWIPTQYSVDNLYRTTISSSTCGPYFIDGITT